MAPTPRPAGWKGGSEDFGFLNTYHGHIANERVGPLSGDEDDIRFGYANVRWGFEENDLGGQQYDRYEDTDLHCDEGSA